MRLVGTNPELVKHAPAGRRPLDVDVQKQQPGCVQYHRAVPIARDHRDGFIGYVALERVENLFL